MTLAYDPKTHNHCVATFSIVGFDPETGEIGVAVQSKFPCVGSVVPWAKAGVGAIATQAWCNASYGPDGLSLLEDGHSPEGVIRKLTDDDPGFADRQVGIVDAKGRSATFTGDKCFDYAGGIAGENFACQGNILVNKETVEAMAEAFQTVEGDLAEKLTMALVAAQEAGGDSRGMQSAALYIAKEGGGYGGYNDRYVDIRVDEHPSPIKELRRILKMYRMLFYKTRPDKIGKIEGDVQGFLARYLTEQGYYQGESATWDEGLQKALDDMYSTENFENRMLPFGQIDLEVVEYLRSL